MLDSACNILRGLRAKHNITRDDLVRKSGYDIETILKYESSKTNDVRLSVFEDLVNSLGYELKIVKKVK